MANGASVDIGPPRQRQPVRRAPSTHVYAIGDTDGRFIKFGRATQLKTRLSQIQIGSPLELQMLGAVEIGTAYDAISVESAIHRAAGRFYLRGEWFQSTPRTLMIVEWMKLGPARFVEMIAAAALNEIREAERAVLDGATIRRRVETKALTR